MIFHSLHHPIPPSLFSLSMTRSSDLLNLLTFNTRCRAGQYSRCTDEFSSGSENAENGH
jgi:hypothetical protein